jgi:hypothetical protein
VKSIASSILLDEDIRSLVPARPESKQQQIIEEIRTLQLNLGELHEEHHPLNAMSGSYRPNVFSEEMEVLPTTAAFFRRISRINTRIPPIARKAAVPCKVANMSHGKLQQETASPSPNLRRCVGHTAVFRKSMEATQAERRRQMHHLSYYGDDGPNYGANDRTEMDISAIREQVTRTVKAMIRRRSIASTPQGIESAKSNELRRVSARKSHENDTLQQATEKKNKFAAKSRKYASMLVPGRRMFTCPSPPMLHANAVF